ncbi:MAG: DUF853 family protein [Acidimicrobiia bacterium]|nr:DUF853 family protein [Acidimicrobiia bacterium]
MRLLRPRSTARAAPASILLGEAQGGDLIDWIHNGTVFYPATVLGRHLVVVGGTGSGKTETLLRLAYGAAANLGWQILYIDAKGDPSNVHRFVGAMGQAGVQRLKVFPDEPYDGWRGEPLALLNRLMAVEDFSEPYYRAVTKLLLAEAVKHPIGPPRSAVDLIDRLQARGQGKEAQGAVARYRGFFEVLEGKLDGRWAFEDADAAYVLLDGLALKEEAAGLGRFLVEDFAHYVARRKPIDRRVLLIVDEFSALSMDADAANLFERVRSLGAAVIVSSQSYAGLGAGADRILDAAAGLICHQSADPERLAGRAGTRPSIERTIQVSTEGGPTGLGSLRQQDAFRVHPDKVRQLEVGECFVISQGRAARVSVTPLRLDREISTIEARRTR